MAKRSAPTTDRAPSRLPWLLGGGVLVAVVATLAIVVAGVGGAPGLTTVSVGDLADASADGATVIDVREPYEYEAGHVDGALLMPLAQTVQLAGDLPKDQPVYVICRSGNRSLSASQALVDAGFQDVRNVDGGMIAWQAAGLPIAR
jgi:rhodanese-related sulfurtransferase